LDFETLDT